MNLAQKNKKISEYQIEDIKYFFIELLRKISSKIILIEFGNGFINIGLAKSKKNKLYVKKVFKQAIPEGAFEKSIPTDPISLGVFLKEIINEQKLFTNRIAISLPSDACYTRLIDLPEEIDEDISTDFVENPNSGIQIPISLENSDFEIHLTNLPKKETKNKIFNKYFLTSLPKKNVDIILESFKNAELEICSLQMSHMCIAELLKPEIDKLNKNELIISLELLDEFTQFVIFDNSGPLLIKRLASIRNYPSIEDMKKINNKNIVDSKVNNNSKTSLKPENYLSLSKIELKVLLREISESFNTFSKINKLNKKGKIFLTGRNSQHKNLVKILGENLKMDVGLISPIQNSFLKEFSYNPDEINQFEMSRLIGLGLTLINDESFEDESFKSDFIIESFSYKDNLDNDKDDIDISKNLKSENKKIKDNLKKEIKSPGSKEELPSLPNIKSKEAKKELTQLTNIKSEEAKKELTQLTNIKSEETKKELTQLPNIKSEETKKELTSLPEIKSKAKSKTNKKELIDKQKKADEKNNNLEIKNNKSFKMDKSFLEND